MRKYFSILTISILVILCSAEINLAQSTWKTLSDLPESTEVVGFCTIKGKIYCISTDHWQFSKPRTIFEYDPESDTWTKKSAMPDKRAAFNIAAINDKIYVVGGAFGMRGPFSNLVNEYDPSTDEWTVKNRMPTVRSIGIPTVVYDNKILVVGGNVSSGATGAVEVYDPIIDKWTKYKSLPTPRCFLTVLYSENKVYAINGFPQGWDDATGPAKITEVLNLQTNEYDTASIPAFPREVMETPYTTYINGKHYLFCYTNGTGVNKLLEFDTSNENFTYKKNMTTIRHGFSEITVNNKIYVVGGVTSSSGTNYTDRVECYDPLTNTWTELKRLSNAGNPVLTECNGKIYALNGNKLAVYDTKDDPEAATGLNDKNTPEDFILMQNYPNPFNPETVISYHVAADSNVELKVFDTLGREISELVNKEQKPGNYQVVFDAKDLNSGIYFYRINAGNFTAAKKMILVR